MLIIRFFVFFLFFPFFLYAKSLIVTSVYPLKLILKEILPENITVYNAVPENANPHFFEVTPKSSIIIRKATAFVGVQKDFDGWIENFLPENAKVLYLNRNSENPHIWLSPKFIIKNLNIISNFFCSIFPKEKNIIIKKAKSFRIKLENLIYKFQFNNLKIVELHPAWDYFANDFGINIIGCLIQSEHNDISIKRALKLMKLVKKEKVKFILASKNIHSNFLKTFAKQMNLKIIYINPLGEGENNYLDFIKNICKKIKQESIQ